MVKIDFLFFLLHLTDSLNQRELTLVKTAVPKMIKCFIFISLHVCLVVKGKENSKLRTKQAFFFVLAGKVQLCLDVSLATCVGHTYTFHVN